MECRNSLSREGCILSSLLFAIYLDVLGENHTGGFSVKIVTIKVLMYVEDIVL